MRSQGVGTKAMEELIAYADQLGKRITLSPGLPDDAQGTTSRSRLVKFYKRFGFKENKGRNRDFSTRDGMIREPKR
jgi:GNAT superfamily N-acetyltransferase